MVAVGVGLSLLSLVVAFTSTVVTGIHTVVGAARRTRHRSAGLGELAGAFPAETLVGLDEALERCLLDVENSTPP